MVTRKDYLDGRISFDEYYTSIVKEAHISLKGSGIMDEVKAALKAGDIHLNTIPLQRWDILAVCAQPAISRSLKAHDDWWSLSGGVCTMKQAALIAAKEV